MSKKPELSEIFAALFHMSFNIGFFFGGPLAVIGTGVWGMLDPKGHSCWIPAILIGPAAIFGLAMIVFAALAEWSWKKTGHFPRNI